VIAAGEPGAGQKPAGHASTTQQHRSLREALSLEWRISFICLESRTAKFGNPIRVSVFELWYYYTKEEGDIGIYELKYSEIDRVEMLLQGEFSEDSIYPIYGNEKAKWEYIEIKFPEENHGDSKFIGKLNKNIIIYNNNGIKLPA
jgi:hypothetical protein